MITLSWVGCYEGPSDRAYFEVLLPRVLEELTIKSGRGPILIPRTPAFDVLGRDVQKVAKQICEGRQAAKLFFVHADTGGRHLEVGIESRSLAYCEATHRLCNWPSNCCVLVTPRKETEAWVLADRSAVLNVLRLREDARLFDVPDTGTRSEKLSDPKTSLDGILRIAVGNRRVIDRKQFFASIAQRQSLAELRRAKSYQSFETRLLKALVFLNAVNAV